MTEQLFEDTLLNTMQTKLHSLDAAQEDEESYVAQEDEESWTIHKVYLSIRRQYSEDYDPKLISIGPLHARKKTLKLMESLKWRYLHDLLHRQGDPNMLGRYINKVRELEVRARKKYAEVIKLDSNAFVRIMVLDACFIIEMLNQWEYGVKLRERVHQIRWFTPLARNDLLLLENQIPFFIVQSLFELSNIPGLPDLEKLAIFYVTSGKSYSITGTVDPRNAYHLLHLLRLYNLSFLTEEEKPAPSCRHLVMCTLKKIGSLASGSFFGLLFLFFYCQPLAKCSKCHRHQVTDEETRRAPRMLPSATELDESGVQFKRKRTASSLLDVTFRDGVMEIPLLSIGDSTAPRFRNLIAFEQCCPIPNSPFSSYATLIDNLIDAPKDVAILKKYGIIESKLGQDEHVANLFNSLREGTYLDFETHHFAKLFKDVNQYCEVDDYRWRARLMQGYFRTPWSAITVIAAFIVVVFIVVLAIYTITAFHKNTAFHKPPKWF